MTTSVPTRTAILDLAQELIQIRGYNGFSFKDLAKGVGITTASIHHHFPTKADLGQEVLSRYRKQFQGELETIGMQAQSHREKLKRFTDLFLSTLRQEDHICLCGMMAAEFETLPEVVQTEVKAFYEETEGWLEGVLGDGQKSEAFRFGAATPGLVAKTFLATLEGAMVAARTFGDEERLIRASNWLLTSVEAT